MHAMTDLLAANPGLRLRAPRMEDAEAVTALVNLVDEHDFGVADLEAEDVRQEWSALDLERDAWHLLDGDTLVGTGDVMLRADVDFRLNLCVHPAWRRRGLGSLIMQRILDRARERMAAAPGDTRIVLQGFTKGGWQPGLAFAAHHGFRVSRRYFRMRIDMTEAPPPPALPDGIEIRTFRPGLDDRATFEAVQDAFADHWGFLPMEYGDWRRRLERPDFDPSLWFLAVRGGEICGTSLCNVIPNTGWIGSLSVRRAYRRIGLAKALLHRSFAAFWERGQPTVALGVDASSLTGATRLYEAVGMRVAESYDQLERELRPGRDLAVRAIED
jgi:mycothiol synthase